MKRSSFLQGMGAFLLAARQGFPERPSAGTLPVPAPIPKALPASPQSGGLVASGGLCAPLQPYYTLTAARPVRDSLAGFQAKRGGISFTVDQRHESLLTDDEIHAWIERASGEK